MQILNIDKFVAPKRSINLAGVSYPIVPLNVQQFIENLTAVEKLEAAAATDSGDPDKRTVRMAVQIKEGLAAIRQAVPSMPEDVLMSLPIEAITAILEFIQGKLDPAASSDAEGSDGKK